MNKKALAPLLFLIAIFLQASAQNTNYSLKTQPEQVYITGTVQNKTGDPLHYAFVESKEGRTGAYTDSLGNFAMIVNPGARIKVSCFGFKDTLINIGNNTSFQVILSQKQMVAESGPSAPAGDGDDISMAIFRDNLMTNAQNTNGIDMAQGAIFPVVHHKEATQGSRFLYDGWVHGYVVNNQDSIVQNPLFMYNYDKIGGNLLLTKDRHAALELYKSTFKSFTLFDAANQKHTFVLIPEIDKTHFVEVLSSGSNYTFYKTTSTKFVASNYVSDGVASSGNNYDEYVDDLNYYLMNAKTGKLEKLTLKKKALRQAFADQADKLKKFFNDNPGDIDEPFVANLCDYLNK